MKIRSSATSASAFDDKKARNVTVYTKCDKVAVDGTILEKKRGISLREYLSVKELWAPNKFIRKKTRGSFMYKNNNFILDTEDYAGLKFSILVIQGFKNTTEVELPDIIEKNIVKEVSCEFIRWAGWNVFGTYCPVELKDFGGL